MSSYDALNERLKIALTPVHSGQVRDTFYLPKWGDQYRLVVASDRMHALGLDLPFAAPGKGGYLTAFNIAARQFLTRALDWSQQDCVAYGVAIDDYLPASLRSDPELQSRAIVAVNLHMVPVELVVRGYLTGSAYKNYAANNGMVCGRDLPPDLLEGVRLTSPLFTPTTKAQKGHIELLDHQEVVRRYGSDTRRQSLDVFSVLRRYAASRGLILVDMKLEAGRQRENGPLIIAGDVGTPDACCFWLETEYHRVHPHALPTPLDKQDLRDWGIAVGIDRFDPLNLDHLDRVANIPAPSEALQRMHAATGRLFEMLWGQDLRTFQKEVMGIRN